MIKSFLLKFGRGQGIRADPIPTTPITVFVGPNNSGKSKVLQELHEFCSKGHRNPNNLILEHVEFESLTHEIAKDRIRHVTLTPHAGEASQPEHIFVGKKGVRHHLPHQQLISVLEKPNSNPPGFTQWYLSYNILKLDGQNRINLVNTQSAGDFQKPPDTSFQVLFRSDTKRAEVRRILYEAFGFYFTIDPTNLGQLRLRLASRAPQSSLEERGIHDEAITYHSNATLIDKGSDGVKAFTGMITEIIAGDPHILLIDEPEAFLHPALAYTLGKEIALASSGSGKRLFVSTHSPHFVMGCIQSGAPVNIVRLTYRNSVATARILPNEDILRLMRNPLLRSTGVLSGLFYEFVIVAESDADRAFYQEINERLLRYKSEWGIPNCLFLNAQNKQTVRTIIKPLRQMGIPAVGIVDVDVLKEGGTVWTDFLSSGFIPEVEQNSMATLRAAIKKKFEETGKDMTSDGGISVLAESDSEAANNLLNHLGKYGLFVVPHGELESWLPGLGCFGHGPTWLIDVFEKMGEDPELPGYLRPTTGDVWAFIGSIKSWLIDPARRGIPS